MLVTVEDGRAIRTAGDPKHSFTQGFLCTKVNRYVERTYHEDRLLHPMIRTGAKGRGKFRRATWDEAIGYAASKLRSIIDSSDGPQAVLPYSYAGTMGMIQGSSMDRRFFHRIGASLLDRTICATAGAEAYKAVYGVRMGTDPESVPHAKLILLWGTNTLTSNPHLWPFIRKARANGASVIAIDPLRTRTAAACDAHIAIRPGTDAALALAMTHVVFRDGHADLSYLAEMTHGWEKLRDRALAEYSPAQVAPICELDVEVIEALAQRYATTRPSFIRLNYGLQRHAGGGNAVRAISILPALTGDWNRPGGGCQLSSSGTFHYDEAGVEMHDWIRPGTRTINMSALGDALNDLDDPPVRALVVYNSNPATVAPDREKVLRGLAREDLFTVVLEHFQTDTADYADVLLPATTQLEHEDVHKAYGHLYWMHSAQSIAPLGESLPNTEIFRRLARGLGLKDPELQASDEELMKAVLDHPRNLEQNITLERLRQGPVRIDVPSPHLPFRSGTAIPSQSGKIEIESSEVAALGLDPVPSYVPPAESRENNPALANRFPLNLISPPAHTFLNSTFVNVKSLRRVAEKPVLQIHPEDARRRAIDNGATVRIRNDRGSFQAEAIVTDGVKRGVVAAPSIWWGKLSEDGANANNTTPQHLTDIGRGATFYDNLVEVESLD
jgi:anaerobic selenocysteine-containing dehydrogenase